jgi:sugar-specific transcriptional regulator TrmB
MVTEEAIARSTNNQKELKLALQERLRDFGLTKNEAKIYVFLSKNGPKKAIEISREENIPRTETYHLLSTLEIKGIVSPSIQRPTRFFAANIEEAIESIIKNHEKKIGELKILKNDMVDLWNTFHNLSFDRKSDILKFESAMKKYAKSSKTKQNLKNKLKEIRQKSDMLDN